MLFVHHDTLCLRAPKLDLSACHSLTDRAIALVTKHCPRLLDVNLSGLHQIGGVLLRPSPPPPPSSFRSLLQLFLFFFFPPRLLFYSVPRAPAPANIPDFALVLFFCPSLRLILVSRFVPVLNHNYATIFFYGSL